MILLGTRPSTKIQYHFIGTYADGEMRRWVSVTSDPEGQVEWYTGGFLPFETVTFTVCPDNTMFCSC